MKTGGNLKSGLASATACAVLLVSLAGCSGNEEAPTAQQPASPAPAPTVTVTVTPSSSPTPTATATSSPLTAYQEVYLSQLRKSHPNLITAPDDGLINIGEGICTIYDTGATSTEVNDFLLISAGVAYSVAEFASIHGAAVAAFCPEYMDKLGAGD